MPLCHRRITLSHYCHGRLVSAALAFHKSFSYPVEYVSNWKCSLEILKPDFLYAIVFVIDKIKTNVTILKGFQLDVKLDKYICIYIHKKIKQY